MKVICVKTTNKKVKEDCHRNVGKAKVKTVKK